MPPRVLGLILAAGLALGQPRLRESFEYFVAPATDANPRNSEADCLPLVRVSRDDARSFSAPEPLPVTPYPSYTGTNHDRLVQLKSGRVLLPLWYTLDYRVSRHILTRVYYSDDGGATWRPSRTIVDLPAR